MDSTMPAQLAGVVDELVNTRDKEKIRAKNKYAQKEMEEHGKTVKKTPEWPVIMIDRPEEEYETDEYTNKPPEFLVFNFESDMDIIPKNKQRLLEIRIKINSQWLNTERFPQMLNQFHKVVEESWIAYRLIKLVWLHWLFIRQRKHFEALNFVCVKEMCLIDDTVRLFFEEWLSSILKKSRSSTTTWVQNIELTIDLKKVEQQKIETNLRALHRSSQQLN